MTGKSVVKIAIFRQRGWGDDTGASSGVYSNIYKSVCLDDDERKFGGNRGKHSKAIP